MKMILIVIPIISLIFSAFSGNIGELSGSIISKSGEAVELVISICGMMCFWSGLMRVAQKAGLLEKLSKLLSVPLSFLFGNLKKGGKAMSLISANIAANILGLGNASTPLGIAAMKAIAAEQQSGDHATNEMIMLAVLNTASLQIIPATAAALRAANGAKAPMEILPCVWIVSAYSLFIAVLSAKLMSRIKTQKRGEL